MAGQPPVVHPPDGRVRGQELGDPLPAQICRIRTGSVLIPRCTSQASCGAAAVPSMPTCRPIVAPTCSSAAMTAPPVMSEWPLRYLVVEWITKSAPSAMGCCRYGEAKVLSTTSSASARCARSATAKKPVTFSSGF